MKFDMLIYWTHSVAKVSIIKMKFDMLNYSTHSVAKMSTIKKKFDLLNYWTYSVATISIIKMKFDMLMGHVGLLNRLVKFFHWDFSHSNATIRLKTYPLKLAIVYK